MAQATVKSAAPTAPVDPRARLEKELREGRFSQFFADLEGSGLTEEEARDLLRKHARENLVVRLSRIISG